MENLICQIDNLFPVVVLLVSKNPWHTVRLARTADACKAAREQLPQLLCSSSGADAVRHGAPFAVYDSYLVFVGALLEAADAFAVEHSAPVAGLRKCVADSNEARATLFRGGFVQTSTIGTVTGESRRSVQRALRPRPTMGPDSPRSDASNKLARKRHHISIRELLPLAHAHFLAVTSQELKCSERTGAP